MGLAADEMQQSILLSYHHNCRTRLADSLRKVPWWSVELKTQEGSLIEQKMTDDWDSYRNALTRQNTAIRKAKRQSWGKYCQGIDQIPTDSLVKVLKSDSRNKIGTLKRADGSFTMTGQEILKVLPEIHFPDSKEVDNCPEEWGQSDLEPYRVNRENWDLLQRTVNRN